MNYIYDVLLNFIDSDRLIEFYEWNGSDCFDHVKRIPIYRISSKQMQEICENKIKVTKDFLEEIKNQTVLFKNKKNIKYGIIICDLNKALALEFSDNGNVISKSSLLLDEEEDILEESSILEENNLDYKIIEPYIINYFLTREELFKRNYLLKELEYISKIKDCAKLTFLYEEIFGKENISFEEKLTRLIEDIKNNFNNKHNELYEVVRLTYTKNRLL